VLPIQRRSLVVLGTKPVFKLTEREVGATLNAGKSQIKTRFSRVRQPTAPVVITKRALGALSCAGSLVLRVSVGAESVSETASTLTPWGLRLSMGTVAK